MIGMAFSNLIALSIIVTTAATLHAQGKTHIDSSAQAAEALKPIAVLSRSSSSRSASSAPGFWRFPSWPGPRPTPSERAAAGRSVCHGSRRRPSHSIACWRSPACAESGSTSPYRSDQGTLLERGGQRRTRRARDGRPHGARPEAKGHGKAHRHRPLYWLGWAATASMALCIVGMAATMFMSTSS
jgi:Natural resistance-associated macrophage protein